MLHRLREFGERRVRVALEDEQATQRIADLGLFSSGQLSGVQHRAQRVDDAVVQVVDGIAAGQRRGSHGPGNPCPGRRWKIDCSEQVMEQDHGGRVVA